MHGVRTLNIALVFIHKTYFRKICSVRCVKFIQAGRCLKSTQFIFFLYYKHDAIHWLSWGLDKDFRVSKSRFLRNFYEHTVCFYELIDNNWRIKASKKWPITLQVYNTITIPSSAHLEYPW